jgi:hypothetical protein
MIGEQDESIDPEGMAYYHISERLPQKGDVFRFAQEFSSTVSDDREKVCSTFCPRSSVFHLIDLLIWSRQTF